MRKDVTRRKDSKAEKSLKPPGWLLSRPRHRDRPGAVATGVPRVINRAPLPPSVHRGEQQENEAVGGEVADGGGNGRQKRGSG